MPCEQIIEPKRSKGHVQKWKCHTNQPGTCRACQRETERRQKELEAEVERQIKRDKEKAEHAAAMAEIDWQICLMREEAADSRAAKERTKALQQKRRDLDLARRLAKEAHIVPLDTKSETAHEQTLPSMSELATDGLPHSIREQETTVSGDLDGVQDLRSDPEREWDRQKRVDGASNDVIDAIMSLTGLEDVKAKILSIKAKIETVLRQGTDMKKERLGVVLLGNPGTGRCM